MATLWALAKVAPLLCTGDSLLYSNAAIRMNQPEKSQGVIGLGGLGQMAVKFGQGQIFKYR